MPGKGPAEDTSGGGTDAGAGDAAAGKSDAVVQQGDSPGGFRGEARPASTLASEIAPASDRMPMDKAGQPSFSNRYSAGCPLQTL